jgi:hypothetical protein
MIQDTEVTRVVFRTWKKGGEVIALFPDDKWTRGNSTLCNSYEHIGQHGGADYQGVIYQTTPARLEDYYDLMRELEGIGYRLKIVRRK